MKTFLSKSYSQKNDFIQSNLQNVNLCRQNSKCKTKKMFSRKPQTIIKTNQNTSKLISMKTKQKNQINQAKEEQYQSETRLKKLLNQSMNLKFVSPKNSKSLQKLFLSQSMQQLCNSRNQTQNQKKYQPQNVSNCKNNKNRSFTSRNLKLNLKLNQNNLQTIIDSEDYYVEDCFKKRSVSYLGEKDDQTLCHETTQESPRGTQSGVFDFSSSDIRFSNVCEKECLQCSSLKEQMKIFSQKFNNLQNTLENKQKQIYQLEVKIQNLETVNRRIEDEKIKAQQQIKQKQFNIMNQKDNIEKQLKCIKNSYNKAIQDLKYKQIQNNINKRYRKQYADLNLKVKNLEEKLQEYKAKAKFYKEKTIKCQKCQYLKRNGSHPVLNLKQQIGLSRKKDQKRQRGSHIINKRYSQDTIFSLSLTSEQED